jgi:hypothetical protein
MSLAPLDPAVIAAVDDLEIVARRVVEGMRSGAHRSPFHGFSAEFSQHRAYRPGDDLKYLDWKLHARTDRLYTRQFHETTNMAAVIAIDTSGSMAFPDKGVSKFRYGVIVAAALAYLIVSQGDSVGLMTSAGDTLVYVPAKSGQLHLRTILARLAKLAPGGVARRARDFARDGIAAAPRPAVRALGFYDEESRVWREMARSVAVDTTCRRSRFSRATRSNSMRGAVEFEDLESAASRVVDAATIGRGYRGAVAEFLAQARQRALTDGLSTLVTTDMPPEETLRRHLLRRGSRPVSHAPRESMIAFANPWAWIGAWRSRCRSPCTCCPAPRHPAPVPDAALSSRPRVVAVRRHRPTDVPLMLIRLAVVAAAVIALAQPLWRNASAAAVRPDSRAPWLWIDRRAWRSRPTTAGLAWSAPQRRSAARRRDESDRRGRDRHSRGPRGRDWVGRASNRRPRDRRHLQLRGRQRERRGRGDGAARRRSQVDLDSAEPQQAARWSAARCTRRSRRVAIRDPALDAWAGRDRGVVGDRSRGALRLDRLAGPARRRRGTGDGHWCGAGCRGAGSRGRSSRRGRVARCG